MWPLDYLSKEPSARTPLEDDVSLIALGINIQLALYLPQLVP